MIIPREYVATCDQPQRFGGCGRELAAATYPLFLKLISQKGWQHGVTMDGSPSKNDRTYCPRHHRRPASQTPRQP